METGSDIFETTTYHEPDPELRHRTISAGEARVAVFTRTYETTIEDLWDACTDPERLGRWYTTVTDDLRLGGTFAQANMVWGTIVDCDAPHLLRLSLGGGADEIELRLSRGAEDGTTILELQHATTLDAHDIGGTLYDAIFCMGGGYYPRFLALNLHLRGTLPEDCDSTAFHLNPDMRPAIDRGSAAMAALLEADGESDSHVLESPRSSMTVSVSSGRLSTRWRSRARRGSRAGRAATRHPGAPPSTRTRLRRAGRRAAPSRPRQACRDRC